MNCEGARFSPVANKSKRCCCVYGCKSLSKRDITVRFHTFPKPGELITVNNQKVDRRKEWIRVLGREKEITSTMRVCSLHFKREDYILPNEPVRKRYLKKVAVPNCNLPKSTIQNASKKRTLDIAKMARTRLNLNTDAENGAVKEEYTSDATDENCDEVEENYEGIKEESIEVEETELDNFIKSEILDSCGDTGLSFSLEQRSQFENGTSQMQDIPSKDHLVDKSPYGEQILGRLDISKNTPNNKEQMLNNDNGKATNSLEIKHEIDMSANINYNDVSSGIEMEFERQSSVTVMQSEGNHFKTGLNFEVVKEEYTSEATDENCDNVKANYESTKEESINIEETELDDFIKNEVLDGYDTGMSFSLAQSSHFENVTSQMPDILSEDHLVDKSPKCEPALLRLDISENISNNNDQILNSYYGEVTNSMEIKHGIEIRNSKCSGLREQYSKSDYGKYMVNMRSSTSSMICAESFTKPDNGVAKSPEIVNWLESKNSLPTAMWQREINTRRIGERITNHCKNDRQRFYGLHQNKNSEEQIVSTSVLHIDLLRDLKEIMDDTRAHELNIDNYGVINGMETENNNHNYLKCGTADLNVNIKSNNSKVTEAEAKLSTATDQRQSNLKRHMTKHTGEKPYKCNSCDYASSRKDGIKKHMRCHTGEKPYKCNSCDYASSRQDYLKIHMAKHTGEKSYKCNSCDYASFRQYDLKIHMRNHIEEKPYNCNYCDYATSWKSSLKIHVRNHTGEKPYKCNLCDYTSSQQANLLVHMAKHTGEKPYKCNCCNYASSRKDQLKIHMAKHTGKKPYKCNSCDYASSRQGDLNIHMVKHTVEKPYKCSSCNYASSRKDQLKIHMAKHTGKRPYKCNSCDYASSRQGDLKVHMVKHTGEKSYKCNSCDYTSSRQGNLNVHMVKHTVEKT